MPDRAARVSTVLADDLETPAGQFTTGAIVGPNGWYYPQNPNPYPGYDATYATSGDTNMWGDDTDVVSDTFIRTTNPVAIPANAYLHFNHAYGFEDDAGGAYDGGVVEYSTAGAGGPWTDAGALFTGPGGANGYTGTIVSRLRQPAGGRAAFVRESNGYGSSRADLTSPGRAERDVPLADRHRLVVRRLRLVHRRHPDRHLRRPDDAGHHGAADDHHQAPEEEDHQPQGEVQASSPASRARRSSASWTRRSGSPARRPRSTRTSRSGKHKFRVYAIDAAGNADPTPAVWKWKIKP